MPTDIREVVQHLRRALLPQDEAGLMDGELLGRFVEGRDEAAVATLMQRHGAMVWGVCRRVLQDHHDAEDAFQATFLVLVRKAATIKPREMVGNWLYGVAHQTARKARAMRAKRRTRERQGAAMPEAQAPEQDTWGDLQPVLDAELSRLPEKYRVAIILCDLEGKTRKEAARQLGYPEGTLAGRLTRGRALLAKRLTRHGLTLAGGGLATLLTHEAASAAVPTSMRSSAIQAVTAVAAGQAAATGVLSGTVAALTQGVIKAMLLKKLKIGAVMLLGIGLLVGGTVTLTFSAQPQEDQEQRARGDVPGGVEEPRIRPQAEPQVVRGAKREAGTSGDPVLREQVQKWAWRVEVVDSAKKTIRLRRASSPALFGLQMAVAPDAKIIINGRERKLADVRPGTQIVFQTVKDGSMISRIDGTTAVAVLKGVDVEKQTVTVMVGGQDWTVPLATGAKIIRRAKDIPLTDLKAGTLLGHMELGVQGGKLVVTLINASSQVLPSGR